MKTALEYDMKYGEMIINRYGYATVKVENSNRYVLTNIYKVYENPDCIDIYITLGAITDNIGKSLITDIVDLLCNKEKDIYIFSNKTRELMFNIDVKEEITIYYLNTYNKALQEKIQWLYVQLHNKKEINLQNY